MKYYLLSVFLILAGCTTASKSYTWQDVQSVVQPEKETTSLGSSLIVYTEKAPTDAMSDGDWGYYHLE